MNQKELHQAEEACTCEAPEDEKMKQEELCCEGEAPEDEKVTVEIINGVPVGRTYIHEDGKESRVEREVRLAKQWEAKGDEDDDGPSMLGYVEMCYDAALALYNLFADQGHSGMSAYVTKNMFVQLVNGDPLSPITGDEEEWYNADPNYENGELVGYSRQNNRMTSLFKYYDKDMNHTKYSYNGIVEVVNDDKVWQTYPPTDCVGSLDEDHPSVKKYFDARDVVRDKHCAEIKLPTKVFPTFKYKWNFDTEELVAV